MQKEELRDVAVIIPAYKEIFLDETLKSLECQTNKNFNIYIGDDNSPYDLESISKKYSSSLNIVYERFTENIGAKNIIKQWKRCIALSEKERWIWLFSDDDIADNNCIEVFYSTIKEDNSKFDVYRFNTRIINDNGELIGEASESPFVDTSIDMAYAILVGQRGNSMPDHIFSRDIYNRLGFVETDYAQSADWATSIQFSTEKGICTMQGAKVNWRLGEFNISGMAKKKRKEMFRGYLQFLKWFIDYYKENSNKIHHKYTYDDICYATEINLRNLIKNHYGGISILSIRQLYGFYIKREENFLSAIKRTLKIYFICYFRK